MTRAVDHEKPMPLLRTLTGWNFARCLVLPTPGEELTIELRAPQERVAYHVRLKSLGLRRLLTDQVCPRDGGDHPASCLKNEPAIASFTRDGAVYRFDTIVETANAPGTNERLLSLRRPKRVERIQRRDAYRVTVETRTTYRPLGISGSSLERHGQIVNLSEGGVLLSGAEPITSGQTILIRIPAGKDGSPMEVMASCIESRSESISRGTIYLSRLRFDDREGVHLSDTQREAIARYLFEQQRLMLQTRRLLTSSKR